MLGLTALLMGIGYAFTGERGMMMALVFAGVMNFVSYWFSDKIVLMMYGAKEIKETEWPQVYSVVRRLTMTAQIPMPKLYTANMPIANAFATGRNPQHAAVVVTRPIVDLLDDNELEAVIAHELSHVRNRDILIASIAATIAGAIFMLARMAQWAAIFGGGSRDREGNSNALGMIAIAIIAPVAAMIIQMAISRSREYQADDTGARMCGKPLALASALRKLAEGAKRKPLETSPVTAHMFIVNPLSGRSLVNLFSTHPPVEERIKKLENIAQEMSVSGYKLPKVLY